MFLVLKLMSVNFKTTWSCLRFPKCLVIKYFSQSFKILIAALQVSYRLACLIQTKWKGKCVRKKYILILKLLNRKLIVLPVKFSGHIGLFWVY